MKHDLHFKKAAKDWQVTDTSPCFNLMFLQLIDLHLKQETHTHEQVCSSVYNSPTSTQMTDIRPKCPTSLKVPCPPMNIYYKVIFTNQTETWRDLGILCTVWSPQQLQHNHLLVQRKVGVTSSPEKRAITDEGKARNRPWRWALHKDPN